MASPPTSRALRFLDPSGAPIGAPREWDKAWVELEVPLEPWREPRLLVNGSLLPVMRRSLAGRERVLAEWDRAGAGYYRLTLQHPAVADLRTTVRIAPWKLSEASFQAMLEELARELPASIALALRRGGALADVEPVALEPASLAEELERLRRAVEGDPARPGLAQILPALASRPHRVLHETELWVPRRRVRRVSSAGLARALRRPGNVDADERLPLRAPDRRVEPSVDVYENRLLRAFFDETLARLKGLRAELAEKAGMDRSIDEIERLSGRLQGARSAASFLDGVRSLTHPPRQLTMVLLRRPEYRAALEGWLLLRRSIKLQLSDPALESPLENTPYLYELWGTLLVVRVLLEAAAEAGYRVIRQELFRRRGRGLRLEPLRANRPALELVHPQEGTRVSLTPQQAFRRTSGELRSVSFTQVPDVVVRIDRPSEPPRLLVFDPKYKLDSEVSQAADGDEAEEAAPQGQPKKVDIDKMHAYRDAIRDGEGNHPIAYACILFPGATRAIRGGVGALSSVPGLGCTPELEALIEEQLRMGNREKDRRRAESERDRKTGIEMNEGIGA